MDARGKLPGQIPYIIGNEAAERFSFYGMRGILTAFFVNYMLKEEVPDPALREMMAKDYVHTFMAGVYLFPLLGGYLADRVWGKYRTILWLSVVYCLGHLCLALFDDNKHGFFVGLFLIALGAGGIKPCVSAMVGDQFDERSRHLSSHVFAAFYWSINLGSFFSYLIVPWMKTNFGPSVAFGLPGVLMLVATLIFWAGRHRYVKVPPVGADRHGFLRVVWTALKGWWSGGSGWGRALEVHPVEAVTGARSVLKVLLVFAPIPFFWALFDQKATTWVLQAQKMDQQVGDWRIDPSQMQFLNPLLVLILVPFTQAVVYPALKRCGLELTLIRRMVLGMFVCVSSWVVAGAVQVPIDAGVRMSILWQFLPYVLLTMAEVLVSTSGLEFAYSQAPVAMKGTIMSAWNLTVAIANLGVAKLGRYVPFTGAALFFFYAGCCLVAAIALALIARNYRMTEHFRTAPGDGSAG